MKHIDIRRIDLNLLIAFEAIYQEGSVTGASERLYLTQSALSHALARLRELCDDPLFERHGKAMVPTDVLFPPGTVLTGPITIATPIPAPVVVQTAHELEQEVEVDAPGAELRHRLGGRLFHFWMIHQAEIVVGANHDTLVAVHNNLIAGRRLKGVKIGINSHRLDVVGVIKIEALLK